PETTLHALKEKDKKLRTELETSTFPDDARFTELLKDIERMSDGVRDPYQTGVERARKQQVLENLLAGLRVTERGRLNQKFNELETEIEKVTDEVARLKEIAGS
ncbi:MAG: hypothetical protein HYT14_00875, partial [Candidatus Liptonbacteria bacterium]|nr:hypothetical protein [Candidatus Liptonbacteria bacterium]